MNSMAREIVALLLVLALTGPVEAGSPPRTVAVAEFSAGGADGFWLDLARLQGQLVQRLNRLLGLRVVGPGEVQAVMRQQRRTPEGLYMWTGQAAEVARAVGADWIVTGRWTHLALDGDSRPSDDPGIVRPSLSVAHAVLQLRVVEVVTRRILLEETFAVTRAGGGRGLGLLVDAAEAVLDRVVRRLVALLHSSGSFDGREARPL